MIPAKPMPRHIIIEEQEAGPRMLAVALALAFHAAVWYAVGAVSWPLIVEMLQ